MVICDSKMAEIDIPIESHVEVVIGDVAPETLDLATTPETLDITTTTAATRVSGSEAELSLEHVEQVEDVVIHPAVDLVQLAEQTLDTIQYEVEGVSCHAAADEDLEREISRRSKDTMKKRILRQNAQFRKRESEKAKQRMVQKRNDPVYRELERQRDRERRAIARRTNTESRAKERERDRQYKQEQREKYGRKLYPTNVLILETETDVNSKQASVWVRSENTIKAAKSGYVEQYERPENSVVLSRVPVSHIAAEENKYEKTVSDGILQDIDAGSEIETHVSTDKQHALQEQTGSDEINWIGVNVGNEHPVNVNNHSGETHKAEDDKGDDECDKNDGSSSSSNATAIWSTTIILYSGDGHNRETSDNKDGFDRGSGKIDTRDSNCGNIDTSH